MIKVFSGDPFLAGRAFERAVREQGESQAREVIRLADELDPGRLREGLAQGGLFGQPLLALDLDAALAGAGSAATSQRNALIVELEAAAADAMVFVLDASATAARQRRWRALGALEHTPTPRYENLVRWVRQELEENGILVEGDVAATLTDVFGEDLPGIAGELQKLRVLGEVLTPERVTELANRPAARNAFQLIDAVMAGDASAAFATLDSLLQAGEAPVRVMAAFTWQVDLVAGCVALRAEDPGVERGAAATRLKASPYAVGKALGIAARLEERTLWRLVDEVVGADAAMKSGSDPTWRLHACVLRSARLMARA